LSLIQDIGKTAQIYSILKGHKGITLIELLVLTVVTTLFVGVLMPSLNRSRQLAYRLLCATNLRSIGSTIAVYASDNEGQYPRAGGAGAVWSDAGHISQWCGPGSGPPESQAFYDGTATITSCFFLLVKYDYMGVKQFYCRGDEGARIFKAKEAQLRYPLANCWDFGGGRHAGKMGETGVWPGECVSYSYHMPFNIDPWVPGFPISQVSREDSPVCADRNPHLDVYATAPDVAANTLAHQGKGQNVLYKGGRVVFEQTPRVGLNADNIWTYGGDDYVGGGDPNGTPPTNSGDGWPQGECFSNDAYLVNEVQTAIR